MPSPIATSVPRLVVNLWGLPLSRASLEAWSVQLLNVGAGLLGALVVFLIGRALITFTLRRAFRPFILRKADSRPHTANRLITLGARRDGLSGTVEV